jgi:uncharacterized alpha-E superfamily protein
MGGSEIDALLQEIEMGGAALVAEAKIGFGTTPSLTPAGLVPKPYALRLFLAATPDGGFAMLPGGLALTVDPERTVALSAAAGESRDVWFVGEAPSQPFTSLWRPTLEAARVRRPAEELPSRAAENLFWLGRYAERADWTMRVLRACLGRLQGDGPAPAHLPACRAALHALLAGAVGDLPARHERTSARLIEGLAHTLMASAEQPCGLPRLLDSIHRTAGAARDRLSSEAWRMLDAFHAGRRWHPGGMPSDRSEALRLLDDGLRVLAAFNGLIDESFTRGFGWTFLDLGRRIARADSLAALLRGIFGHVAGGGDESGSLLLALEVADSFITYRSRYRLEPLLPLLLDLLLVDESNPRGVAFQLARIEQHIDALPQSDAGGSRTEEQRLALSLLSAVRLADIAALSQAEPSGARKELQKLLDEQSTALAALADSIGRRYFDLVEKGATWVRTAARGAP